MSDRTTNPQQVTVDRSQIPPHLLRYAQNSNSKSLNVNDTQPLPPSLQHVMHQQAQFDVRDERERTKCSDVSLEDVRNLHRQQNALFRPTARIGNERRVAADNPIGQLVALENGNLPMSEILCAMDKQERMRAQVDRRIAEAKAAGFKGNDTLERARAMRTGTMVPRKTNNNGSALLVGNNQPGTSGGASSTASYEIGYNESNNFLRRMTGVEFEGDKCQRMARKERAIIAPQPMPEPPPGFLPGGGRFLDERERLDYAYDNPHLSGNFIKPMKPINPSQWTDRPVSYRPPIRDNLADQIPFDEPTNRGVFMQPEPIGYRVSSEDSVPFKGMPGDSYGAVEQMQICAPRDVTIRDKLRKNIGPEQPAFPFAASYDDVPVAQEERLASYTVIKPKDEKEHLTQGSVDSISRGIQLVDEAAMFDPAATAPFGIRTGELERQQRSQMAEKQSTDAAAQQFQAARLIGDNETFTAGTMSVDLAGQRGTQQGLQRETSAAKEYMARSDLHSRVAVSGDPEMLHDNAQVAALERGLLQAPQERKLLARQQQRETKAMQGKVEDLAASVDESQFIDVGRATVSQTGSVEQEQRSNAKEKLALLKSRMAARRANAYDDDLLFEDTAFARQAANAIVGEGNLTSQKMEQKDRIQSQRNFQRVCDALQRVRLTVTDLNDDPIQDFSGVGDRLAANMAVQTKMVQLQEKTRQLEQRMMNNASDTKILLDETKFIDTINPASATRVIDMRDSIAANRLKTNEVNTMQQSRFQFQRQSAFEGVEPQTVGLLQQKMQTSLQDGRKIAQKEKDMQQTRITSNLDMNQIGDNSVTRILSNNMTTSNQQQQQRGVIRGATSMQAAAQNMQAENFGSGLDLQNAKMATQQDVRAIDTNRQALIDQRIMAQHDSKLTALDEMHPATMYQESLVTGGSNETARRARAKGVEREKSMYVADAAARQALRVTDSGMFEHHTVDASVGAEPRGGKEAFDRRSARREEWVQDTAPIDYDAVGDVLTVDHILQRLESTRCDKPSAALYAQRQEAHEKEMARLERGPPLHLLPPHMCPGGKKVVTPRGSPAPSPIPR